MSALLDFHDAVLYTRDVKNFEVGNWLNDACIAFCLRHMEYIDFPTSPYILFMDPSVVSLIKVQSMDEEDLAGISKGLKLSLRKLLFVPTNDNNSFEESSSHWSLLVIDVVNKQSYHFDSCRPKNSDAAAVTFERMKPLLNWERYSPVRDMVEYPQQTNGFDCGIYVCLCAHLFAASPMLSALLGAGESFDGMTDAMTLVDSIAATISATLTPALATTFRTDSINTIHQLSTEYLASSTTRMAGTDALQDLSLENLTHQVSRSHWTYHMLGKRPHEQAIAV